MKVAHGWAFPDADRWMLEELAPDGTYQMSHLQRALAWVQAWDVAVDGGAHVGTWTKVLAGRFAHVVAVEPAPDTVAALTANMQTFGCTNVDIRPVALGATMGRVNLTLAPAEVARGNTGGRYVTPGGTIPMETLDSWQLPALDFLKLDVEGSEYAALVGARATIARYHPIILYENKFHWTRYGVTKDGPATLLTSLGYELVEVVGHDVIWGCP